uniref:Kinesin light chain n=1 Tax=Ditylum brightwellii TaxID=49249 RepID=A0A7S4RXZ9_9STRA
MPGGNNQGRYGEAEELFRPFLEVIKSALGEAHPHTLGTMSNLAAAVRGQGRYEEAEELFRQCLEAKKSALGEAHPDTLATMNNLAIKAGTEKQRCFFVNAWIPPHLPP